MDVDMEIEKTRSLILKMHVWLAVIFGGLCILVIAKFSPQAASEYGPSIGFLSAINVAAALGHMRKINGFRHLSAVISIVLLFLFPIGTLFGVILLGQSTKKEWVRNEVVGGNS